MSCRALFVPGGTKRLRLGIAPPIVVLITAPGLFRACPFGVSVAIRDVSAALMPGQKARLLLAVRQTRIIEGPGLRVHATAGGDAAGASRISDNDKPCRIRDAGKRGCLIETEIRVGLIPGLLICPCQIGLIMIVAVVRSIPFAGAGRRKRRSRRAFEYLVVLDIGL